MIFYPENTAIVRNGPSAPLKHILKKGFPKNKNLQILDYGCGYGEDVQYLKSIGYRRAIGYDPYLFNSKKKVCGSNDIGVRTFDAIFLTYVLCCIPNEAERNFVLCDCYSLLKQYGSLYISARSEKEIERAINKNWVKCGDGWISSFDRRTFQKGYSMTSLTHYVGGLVLYGSYGIYNLSTSKFVCLKVQKLS